VNADIVTFGPVFSSPGKSQPTGLTLLAEACRTAKSVYALGGITWENAAACMQAGATGIAGIRLFQQPDLD
jgi:thiamine-phosphate pyrophosphorylase